MFGEQLTSQSMTRGALGHDELPALVEKAVACVAGELGSSRFPRSVLESLGDSGVIRRRWDSNPELACPAGDVEFGIRLGEELVTRVPTGVASGVSVHCETVLSMLHRFGANDYLREVRDDALAGRAIGCVAASEAHAGSDLSSATTLARRTGDGWVVSGRKKYVSLGAVADFAIVLCRVTKPDGTISDRNATFVVPLADTELIREHDKLGTHILDTVVLDFVDIELPDEAVLGRIGLGLLNLNYGLSFERLSIAAQLVAGCQAAISLAVEHSERRIQFGKRLRDHQYLAFRMAEGQAEIDVLKGAVTSVARDLMTEGLDRRSISRIASLKLRAARTGERIMSDAMQVFGGVAYLPQETPIGQFWIDSRVARIAGGTDEMMLAIIADSMCGNPSLYDQLVTISQ